MNKNILISVAWPYVNGNLHVGHLSGYLIPADIEARFQRLLGRDVLMVSGSDCHGTPITIEADKRGKKPSEIVDEYHKRDVKLFKQLNLSYNLYTKTTAQTHKKVVQKLFLDLLHEGYIIKKLDKQYYSEKDGKFLPDRYVEGECPYCHAKEQRSDQCEVCGRMLNFGELINPYSKLTKSKVTLKQTEHYYLDLEKLSNDLRKYVKAKKDTWKNWVYKEALGWLDEGLKPRPITRDLDWGIELPVQEIPGTLKLESFKSKRIYVWFEAVTGYLSASIEWSKRVNKEITDQDEIIFNIFKGQDSDWEKWWIEKNAYHYYFLGQDNVVFHTILWPGQLLGAKKGYHLPDNVVANKFMNLNGKKFSKSRGNIVDSKELIEEFGVDEVRFFIARTLPENKEGNFTWEGFVNVVNNELIANLGNFINRTLSFLQKHFESNFSSDHESFDEEVVDSIKRVFEKTQENFQNAKFVDALDTIMNLSHFANKYFNDSKLWEIIKSDKAQANKVMNNLMLLTVNLSILIYPVMPNASDKLRQMLSLDKITPEVSKNLWQVVYDYNVKLVELRRLFNKIDYKIIKEKQKGKLPTKKQVLSKVRIVEVVSIDKHPNADRLFVVEVRDLKTNEKYTVVAGAGNIKVKDRVCYLPVGEVIPGPFIRQGKTIILKEKKIRGVLSKGMLLAEDELGISDDHEDIFIVKDENFSLNRLIEV